MIHIDIDRGKETLKVNGHANDAKHPRCIDSIRACEVITFQVQQLVASIHAIGKDKPFYELHSGDFFLQTTGLSEKSRTLVDSFIVGVKLASTAYNDYISVVEH